MKASALCARLKKMGDHDRARVLQRFFKTGPGEYAAGDVFVGLCAPQIRQLGREYRALPLAEVMRLLRSPLHEARLLALVILVQAYQQGDELLQKKIFNLYLANTRFINNWDLVDVSAEHIVGAYLRERDKALLGRLAKSGCLWERRMAVLATFHFTRRGEFAWTLRVAKLLLRDPEDLIHKAAGWMLREVGKRDRAAEEKFLKAHGKIMPRTMLRYAIERFPERVRQKYLRGKK